MLVNLKFPLLKRDFLLDKAKVLYRIWVTSRRDAAILGGLGSHKEDHSPSSPFKNPCIGVITPFTAGRAHPEIQQNTEWNGKDFPSQIFETTNNNLTMFSSCFLNPSYSELGQICPLYIFQVHYLRHRMVHFRDLNIGETTRVPGGFDSGPNLQP